MKFFRSIAIISPLLFLTVPAAAQMPRDLSMRPRLPEPAGAAESAVARRADRVDRAGPMAVSLAVDLPITALGLLATFLPDLVGGQGPDPGPHRPETVNGLDRGATRNWSPAADTASTVLMAGSIVLPVAASLVDTWAGKREGGYRAFLEDTLILAESYGLTTMVTSVVKVSVHRARPLVYNASVSEAERSSADANRSFFSGHTATAFCMATSYSYLFTKRHPRSKAVIPVWIGTHALAAATGFLRVEAGKHFWSDVLVGAAVGSAIGLAVPYLHTRGNFFARLFFGGSDPEATRLSPAVSGDGVGLRVVGAF